MAFELSPADASFLDSAPMRFVFPMRLAARADEVWQGLTGDATLGWVHGLSVRWTSPRPYGVGSTRIAAGGFGAVRLYETFFRWEEGRRYSFYAHAANLPVYRRFVEDYLVEPAADGGCTFTWTFAAQPRGARGVAAVLGAAQRPVFAAMARDTRRHFGTR